MLYAMLLLNQTTHAKFSPLMAASAKGHALVVLALLQMGAAVDGADTVGTTALHLACQNGRSDASSAPLGDSTSPPAGAWRPREHLVASS